MLQYGYHTHNRNYRKQRGGENNDRDGATRTVRSGLVRSGQVTPIATRPLGHFDTVTSLFHFSRFSVTLTHSVIFSSVHSWMLLSQFNFGRPLGLLP